MTWADDLSNEQREYASHGGRVLRLVAGPGTGKTRVMTRRVAYLIEDEQAVPTRILALTFSRAAAQELRERLEALLGAERGDRPVVSTLHAFALRQLMRNEGAPNLPSPIRIADDYEERWVIQEMIARLASMTVANVKREFANLASDWETLKADEDEWERQHPNPRFLGAWRHHRQVFGYTLRAELVYSVKKALEQNPNFELERDFTHVLVDEYQDLNKCEIDVIRRLVGDGRRLFVAGDDDQSIYGFRNAFPQGLREFADSYPGADEGELTECYRCDRRILALALSVAEQDPDRLPKELRPLDGAEDGDVRAFGFADGAAEATGVALLVRALLNAGVPPEESLILLRNDPGRIYSQPIIDALAADGIEAELPSNPFAILSEPRPRLALCLLRLARDPQDSLAWYQVLQLRENSLGTATLRRIYDVADERGERFAQTLAETSRDPEILGGPRRRAVKDEYDEIAAITQDIATRLEDPAAAALPAVFELASSEQEQAARAIEVLLSLLDDEDAELSALLPQLARLGSYRADQPEVDSEVPGRVRIMSMHSAKGLTVDAVIVAACEDELIPGPDRSRRAVDDQRRLLYVSLTRARHYLFVTYAGYRPGEQSYRLQVPPQRTYCSFLTDYLPPELQ